jgi:hypothetical protein
MLNERRGYKRLKQHPGHVAAAAAIPFVLVLFVVLYAGIRQLQECGLDK